MNELQTWISRFQNPVYHQKCIGIYGYPDEEAFAFCSNLESNSEIRQRWVVQPFHTGGGLPGFSIPIQEKIQLNAETAPLFLPLLKGWSSQFSYHQTGKAEFIKGVQLIQKSEKYTAGKVVLSIRQPVALGEFNPIETFLTLRSRYPRALVWFLSCPIFGSWIGASPELLLQKKGSVLESWSLAGTKHHSEPNWTSKEQKEQSLVTKYLERTFLDFGLNPLIQTEGEEIIMGDLKHLRTRIMAETAESLPKSEVARLAARLHPSPAVGAYPATDVFEQILALEGQSRAYYSGYLGLEQEEQTQFYVNLRCAEIKHNTAILFSGAGITAESNAESEWTEVQRKAELLRTCLPLPL